MIDILIIEDNKELGKLIFDFLKRDGYAVSLTESAEDGLRLLDKESCRLLLLDVMLPGKDGFHTVAEIRKTQNMPIIMMSARTDDESKILGLDMGADDYLDKPFSFPVLLSKIKATLRRNDNTKTEKKILAYEDIILDERARTVLRKGEPLSITGKEFEILRFFMKNPEQAIDKETLFNAVWGVDCFSDINTLNVYIRWLREKLEDNPKNPKLIQTVWRVGYIFGGKNKR